MSQAMQNSFDSLVANIAEETHEQITEAVEAGEAPPETAESVGFHKTLVCAHVVDGARQVLEMDDELDYDEIEEVAEREIVEILEN